MPGRCCSSTRRRAHRCSPPHRAVRSWTRQVAPDAPAHGRSLSPRRVRRTARRPHIPTVLPRARAGRSPRHASRSGVAAGLSRVAPHAPGGPPRHAPRWPSSPCVELGRSTSITFQVSARRFSSSPAERVRDHRDPSATRPIFFRLSSLVATRRRPTTPDGPDARLPERRVNGVAHRRWTVSPARHGPRRPFLTGLACCPQGCPLRCHILWISVPRAHATTQPRS